ncbi:MAG: ABC transporter permease [Nocardioides sp.]|uniref:ABC transporter permease n=1 Tax=Nocardioides sp. TaxID=35761 RepID=UPI0039E4D845
MTVAGPGVRFRRPRNLAVRLRGVVPKLGFILALLLLWQVLEVAGRLGGVPSPVEVGRALVDEIVRGAVWAPVGTTLVAWAVSFVLASVIGLVVGFALGASRLAYQMSVFTLDFCRTIPTLALVPLAILMYGAGLLGTVVLAVFGSVWAVLLQAIYGVRDVDPVARDTFRSYHATRFEVVTRLVLPTAAPYVATGLRLAAAISLLLTLSAEIVMPAPGIGEQIVISQLGDAVPRMYAYIVLSGLLGVALNAVFVAAERRALRWHPSHREELH